MGRSIAIVDYGMGNLGSVANALRFLGYVAEITSDGRRLAAADAIVLPGVGAFARAMDNLRRRELLGVLSDEVKDGGKPFLGICLGMQLVAESSSEMGLHEGLGWIAGRCEELQPAGGLAVPHVGWNNVRRGTPSELFKNLPPDVNFYFDHSYRFVCDDRSDVAGVCEYGGSVVAALQRGNLFAVQFHPEKSQTSGLKLLRNFLNYVEAAAERGESAC